MTTWPLTVAEMVKLPPAALFQTSMVPAASAWTVLPVVRLVVLMVRVGSVAALISQGAAGVPGR